MSEITHIAGRQILDSRGNPTIEVTVVAGEVVGDAAVPSGASTGAHEASELRDGGKAYGGKGVQKAIENLSPILKTLQGMDVCVQRELDEAMIALDGTKNKSKLGANALLGVSLASARAAACSQEITLHEYIQQLAGTTCSLPVPFANVLNGGKHAAGGLPLQEIMIVPTGAKTFAQATQMVCEVYAKLKKTLHDTFGGSATLVGDEGGFAPPFKRAEDAFDTLMKVVKEAGYEKQIHFAIDAAATEFYEDGTYTLHKKMDAAELVEYYLSLIEKYPIISLEDPFAEDDFAAFALLMEKTSIQVVGDDLLVTNMERMEMAKEKNLCNALLLKVNQIGTLTESLDAATRAQEYGWKVMVSHRSGETEDPFIADLAVALGCGQIKLGAPCRSDRTAKYNQLLRIEEETGLPYTPNIP